MICCLAAAAIGMNVADPFFGAAWLTVPESHAAIQRAHWIWQKTTEVTPTTANAPAGEATFRRDFDSSGGQGKLTFACDNRCVVFLNDIEVGRSEDWASPTQVLLDGLRNGANTLRVEATNDAATGNMNPAGFIAALEVDGKEILSDATWGENVVDLGPASVDPWRLRAADLSPCPIFRRAFNVASMPAKATLRIIGLGHYQAFINGRKVGDAAINQPWSQYDKRIYYRDFDITSMVKPGGNAIGVMLGNGFWRVGSPPSGRAVKDDAMPDFSAGRQYLLRFVIFNEEGVLASSDSKVKYTAGPVTLSHIYAGEDFDARREPEGWDEPNFHDGDWAKAMETSSPAAELSPQTWPDLRPKESFSPTRVFSPKPGVWTYVFPQNAAAIVEFTVRGKEGLTFRIKPSEVMNGDGVVEQLNLWGRSCTFDYTLSGNGAETHRWLFHYSGFQYVEVTGAVPRGEPNPDGLPEIDSLRLIHVRTDNPIVGEFHSGSELYNRTHDLVDWAMRSNMSFVMTDCPHREKLGWLECAHLLMPTFAYRYDCKAWFEKICADMRDAQLKSGCVLNVAPEFLMRPADDMYMNSVEWGSACVLLPWQAYEWYGDVSFLKDNFAMMRRYADYLLASSTDGIAHGALGDWYDYGHGMSPGPSRFTPTQLTATACWAICADAVARTAKVLGDKGAEAKYRRMFESVRSAFLAKFYDPKKKTCTNSGSPQAGCAMALCAEIIPESDRAAVLETIIADLKERSYQQTTGDIGHLFLIRALASAGRSDVLHKIYSRTGKGSYGGIIERGLTTMPETWDALTVGSNSLNHCMLGHVIEWFYGWVLGIRQELESVGWSKILIAPEPGELSQCSGSLMTPRGKVAVDWKLSGGRFEMDVTLPTAGTVLLPVDGEALVEGKQAPEERGDFGRRKISLPKGRSRIAVSTIG
jgi:hypothetical protein